MPEWWQTSPAEKIVDHLIEHSSPQYPSARVIMHIEDEALLARVRAVILCAEVADTELQWTLRRVAERPYQDHFLPLPEEALRESREVYISVIRRLVGLGVVRAITASYGSSIF